LPSGSQKWVRVQLANQGPPEVYVPQPAVVEFSCAHGDGFGHPLVVVWWMIDPPHFSLPFRELLQTICLDNQEVASSGPNVSSDYSALRQVRTRCGVRSMATESGSLRSRLPKRRSDDVGASCRRFSTAAVVPPIRRVLTTSTDTGPGISGGDGPGQLGSEDRNGANRFGHGDRSCGEPEAVLGYLRES